MTNIEKIKNMSVAEMAAFIRDVYNAPCLFCGLVGEGDCAGKCNQGHIKWLESEAEQ